MGDMQKHSLGKLWNVVKGDSVSVNGLKLLVDHVDSFDAEDEHEEFTKEIFLKGKDKEGAHAEFMIELSDSLRTFYLIERPDSFTKKKTELPVENISPE